MPQSLAAVYLHLVFSTRDRRPFLADKALRDPMHAYLGGIARTLECEPIRVGGVEDHVHLLVGFPRTLSVADLIKELKRVSTLKMRDDGHADFFWQSGYGAFSVSKSNLPEVARYIENQEEHHRHLSFQDEYRAFLKKHDLVWDERHVWE